MQICMQITWMVTLKLQFEVYLSLFGREEVVVCMGMVCLTAFERLL